jgi:tetratricopeptide (TPR) repeat protein
MNAGNYPEAIKLYEGIPQNVPDVAAYPEANFRLGYIYFLTGEYDKASPRSRKTPRARTSRRTSSNSPRFSSRRSPSPARASCREDPARKEALAEAVKQFDAFVAKFPQSEEVESANVGKARALFQMQDYDEAIKALRATSRHSRRALVARYAVSCSRRCSAPRAAWPCRKPLPPTRRGGGVHRGRAALQSIIQKRTDIALVNDAHFQLGELLAARGGFAKASSRRSFSRGRSSSSARCCQRNW